MMDRDLQEKIAGAEAFRNKRKNELGFEEFEPFYERVPKGRLKPDAKAIAAFDAMVAKRPLAPPGRPLVPADEEDIQAREAEEEPDANCVTSPDGNCTGIGCMHDVKP